MAIGTEGGHENDVWHDRVEKLQLLTTVEVIAYHTKLRHVPKVGRMVG
jgi:hypothetical protein